MHTGVRQPTGVWAPYQRPHSRRNVTRPHQQLSIAKSSSGGGQSFLSPFPGCVGMLCVQICTEPQLLRAHEWSVRSCPHPEDSTSGHASPKALAFFRAEGRPGVDIDVPFKAEHATVTYSLPQISPLTAVDCKESLLKWRREQHCLCPNIKI